MIAVRLAEVTLLPGVVTVPRIARFEPVAPPPPARADIVDRNGRLLATTLDSPSLYANPRQILDAADATRKLVAALPGLDARRNPRQADLGQGFCLAQAPPDAATRSTRSTSSAFRACNSSTRSAASTPMAR